MVLCLPVLAIFLFQLFLDVLGSTVFQSAQQQKMVHLFCFNINSMNISIYYVGFTFANGNIHRILLK